MNGGSSINAYNITYGISNNILRYNLRFYREKHNLSQNELSIRTGLQRSYIAEVESGKRNPSISKIYQLAISLKLSPWRLLKPITLKEKLYDAESNFTTYDITLNEASLLTVEEYMEQLAANIRTFRKDRKWTQKELALFSGLSYIFICNIEQGRKEPTIESLSKISMAFHIPVWRLIIGTDECTIWFYHDMWL